MKKQISRNGLWSLLACVCYSGIFIRSWNRRGLFDQHTIVTGAFLIIMMFISLALIYGWYRSDH